MSFDNRHIFNKFFVHKIASLSKGSLFNHSQCADLMSISIPCFAFYLDSILFVAFEFELWSFQLLAILEVTQYNQIVVICHKTTSSIRRVTDFEELSTQISLNLVITILLPFLNSISIIKVGVLTTVIRKCYWPRYLWVTGFIFLTMFTKSSSIGYLGTKNTHLSESGTFLWYMSRLRSCILLSSICRGKKSNMKKITELVLTKNSFGVFQEYIGSTIDSTEY